MYNINLINADCILLLASVGTFTSPNYPANYSNNANICWLITGAFNIKLNFTSFATEVGRDSLKVCIAMYLLNKK